mgnify:CR=1 FL=1
MSVTGLPVTVQFGIAGIEPDETGVKPQQQCLKKYMELEFEVWNTRDVVRALCRRHDASGRKMDFDMRMVFLCNAGQCAAYGVSVL